MVSRMDGPPELALDGSDMDAEPKALGESHALSKLNPSQHQEAAERTKARRSLQTENVQDSDQRQEGAKRTQEDPASSGLYRPRTQPASLTPRTPGARPSASS